MNYLPVEVITMNNVKKYLKPYSKKYKKIDKNIFGAILR